MPSYYRKMLRNREYVWPRSRRVGSALCVALALLVLLSAGPQADAKPLATSTTDYENSTLDNDLYVIKAVVYEIGILTDADNTTSDTTERQEEVKISFFDQPNGNTGSSEQPELPIPELLFSSYNATL